MPNPKLARKIKRTMNKTKFIYPFTLVVTVMVLLTCCGTAKISNKEKSISNYKVKFVPNEQNDYEGNIIVKVLDSEGEGIVGAKVFIYSEKKQISELTLSTTFVGVFNKQQKNLSIKATKVGYLDCETEIISMSPDNACFIELKMVKK